MNQVTQALKLLGLTENEIKVYLTCLELGSGNIHEVAERAKIKRTSIYNYLEDMKSKGIISTIESPKGMALIPTDPNSLIQKSRETTENLQSILPDLMGIYNLPGEKPRVKNFEGVEGLKKVYDEILKAGENILAFTDVEKMMSVIPDEYMWEWAEKRAEAGINIKTIIKDSPEGRKAVELDKKQNRQSKLVKNIEFDTEINIYGNRVAILSFRQPYMGIIIENRAIAQTLSSIWKAWWVTIPEPKIR